MLNEMKFRLLSGKITKILTILCLSALVLQAQDITNKLGASGNYDVTDSADKILLRVQGDGKVGIGMDNPTVKLHIYDDIDPVILILQDINTGTGVGSGAVLGFDSNSDFWIMNAEGTDLNFGTNGNIRMTIDNNGKVGIGTTAPDANLDVHGTVKAFGAWDASLSFGTVYTAQSDGFVVAYSNIGGSSALIGITDSYAPPTTIRTIAERSDPGHINIMMPVKKGDMWKVDRTGVSASGSLFWIPLGQ